MFETFETLVKQRKMKYADVAKGAGIPYSTITDWKAGRYTPKLDKLQKIADFLNVSVEYLATGKETEVIMGPTVISYPCLNDPAFMDLVMRLHRLPPERRDPILRMIRLEDADYKEELKKKEGALRA